jgi:hypothetical protein
LRCADCGLEVATRYAGNEFAGLTDEQLHLLRIFVLCEGRIRDMEAALGVSYPTVKARLASLRIGLGLDGSAPDGANAETGSPNESTKGRAGAEPAPAAQAARAARAAAAATAGVKPGAVGAPKSAASEILDRLARGELTHTEAMAQIRALRR